VKFLVDMPLSPELAHWLTAARHDAVHAGNIGLARATDSTIMERARLEQRTVITADLDYPQLLALSRADEPSVILFRGGNWSDAQVVAPMGDVLRVLPPGELERCIVVVDRARIRRRKLPIS